MKKNQVMLNEFVEYNSLNKFSKYKFYIIKDFKYEKMPPKCNSQRLYRTLECLFSYTEYSIF